MSKLPGKKIRSRIFIIGLLMIGLGFGAVIYNLYNVQITEGETYLQKAIAQQLRTSTLTAGRGSIYDSNMNVLADSKTVWKVLFSPASITDEEAELLGDAVSEILGVDRQTIVEKAKNKTNYYYIIKRKVEKEDADKVIAFASEHDIAGVSLEPDSKRYYPYGSLASTVLGFVNDDNNGAYGIEAYYNSVLSGVPGRVVTAKNAWGTDMPFRYQDISAAKDGNSIALTIDANIQSVVETHLTTALAENPVKNKACCVVMDVKTGAILAMASMPDYDPNEPRIIKDEKAAAELEQYKGDNSTYLDKLQEAQFYQWNNKAVSEPYEPGSVFKIITTAIGLETDVTGLEHSYYCPGYHVVGGIRKSCWRKAGHGSQDLAAAIKNSCNPAYMMIGEAIGPANFMKYFKAFGLNTVTGVDLPGEADGYFYTQEQLDNVTQGNLQTAAFGQTFKVTPLQLITAVSAAVNGGYLYEPYIVSKVIDPDGNVISETQPTLKRQVISEETSALVRTLIEGVVTEGSGKSAHIIGYRIGGKTGTSEKLDTADDDYIYSFVGVAPMEDPQVAVLVLMDDPYDTTAYGSTVATPVVGSILADILPYMGIEKTLTEEQKANQISVPNVVGLTTHMGRSAISEYKNLEAVIVGSGGSVIAQIPAAGTVVSPGSKVVLYSDESSMKELVTVPDVTGKSGAVANSMIINAGLNIEVTGVDATVSTAIAARQSIAAGEQVKRGTVITVNFTDSEYRNSY